MCTKTVKTRHVLDSVTSDELVSVDYVLQDLVVHVTYM